MEPPLRRNHDFVALWLGQAVSNLGISISSFAYPVVVLEATGSPAKAGAVGSVLAATAFVLRLPAGLLVDRWNRRAIMVVCDLGRALNSGALALVLALGHFVFAQVLAVAFVEAALGVFFGPAESAAIRRVVGPEQLRQAIAQNQSRSAIPGLIGPPIGGVLLAVSRALPFLGDAVSYVISLISVASVRTRMAVERSSEPQQPLRGVTEGIRWIWRRRFLRTLLVWLMLGGLIYNAIGLLVLVIARNHGASPSILGLMFAITGAGGVIGALLAPTLIARAQPHRVVIAFGWLIATAVFLLLVVHAPLAIGFLGAAALLLVPAVNAIAFAAIAEADDRMQGRAVSAGNQLTSLGAPLAPLIAGLLLSRLGEDGVVEVYGAALAALAVVATLARGLRRPHPARSAG